MLFRSDLKRPVTLMPSERLYDLLEQAQKEFEAGCGSGEHSHADESLESRMKASQVGQAVLGAAGNTGGGFRGTPPLPAVPEWIAKVLDWLVTRVVAREERVRASRQPCPRP